MIKTLIKLGILMAFFIVFGFLVLSYPWFMMYGIMAVGALIITYSVYQRAMNYKGE